MAIVDVIPNKEMEKEIAGFLQSEIDIAENERADLAGKWGKWRRQREGRPEQESKDFPWKGASNITVPLAQMNTNGISAALKSKFAAKTPFLSAVSNDKQKRQHADAITDYLSVISESKFHLDIRKKNNEIFYETASMGTQFVLVPWLTERHKYKRRTDVGVEDVIQTRHNGPAVMPIKIEDFYARGFVEDIQRAPWISIRWWLAEHELIQRGEEFIYENTDKVIGKVERTLDNNWDEDAERQGLTPTNPELYQIYETYLYWDVDGDGIPEDIKVWIELTTGTILRAEYNELGIRPITRIPYIPFQKSLYGMGIGWMSEYAQDGVDALMNMAINSTHISSLQMFVTRRGGGIGANEKFYPLKNLQSDSPKEDFFPIQFPNTSQPNLAMINFLRELTDRTTGATNAMMGAPDSFAKTRATASGTMFLAQQGSKLFDAISENVEEAYAEIGMFIMFQLIHHKDEVDLSLIDEEKRPLLKEVLNMSLEDVHLNFNFQITSTELDKTEEAKRQSILTLSQLYNMYGQQTLQLIQSQIGMVAQINPQGVQQLIQKYQLFSEQFLVGSAKLMEKILAFFDTDKEGYIPYTKDISMMLEMINGMKDQQLGGMNAGQNQGIRPGAGSAFMGGSGFGGPQGGAGGMEGPQGPIGPETGE